MAFLFAIGSVDDVRDGASQTPPLTVVNDVVYRADGSAASGTLRISWPAFTTAGGKAIAAGVNSAQLGTGETLSVELAANAGATPAGTVYTVVYQLSDGEVKTEYWTVPTNSPTTIAAVRTVLGASNSASQMATQQFVNSGVASKANDSAVVHLSGSETITGIKQFSVAPSLPAPQLATDAANKSYVDSSACGMGSGSFVRKVGDTMTGPLFLSADPTASTHAADKHYVDLGLTGKADLVAGLVAPAELGSGFTNNSVCLHGDSTWGGCGTSTNAVSIQNVAVDTTLPSDNQASCRIRRNNSRCHQRFLHAARCAPNYISRGVRTDRRE
ncbi:MAG: hypothetical protein NVS1B11_29740 [Terriglobales bacterium]